MVGVPGRDPLIARVGPSLVCPELVGRDTEAATLRGRVAAAVPGAGGTGTGGVVVLVGEAGTGKSRLVGEATTAARKTGLAVLAGRAVPGSGAVAYRPIAEALLAAFRSAPPVDAPELTGFHGHLARIVPSWSGEFERTADDSPVLLSEAVVRVLGLLGRDRGCVLVLEDLHWADPETVDAVDYLADALKDVPVLCVCTTRPEGTAAELGERLGRRDRGSVVPVASLPPDDVDRMVVACLQTTAAPAEIGAFVRAHSEGNPFLVEELLAGLVASGALTFVEGRWTSHGDLTPTVPVSLRESIRRRVAALDPTSRRVVDAAAVLGRRFDWQLLPGIAEVDGRQVVDGLRGAVAEQLVDVEGNSFSFRHALTREAVLADLLPPDRLQLAQRAWPALERAHPGLPGAFCELAAELAEAAGEPVAAAALLVESARRALEGSALVTAEATTRRARRLAPSESPVALDTDELLVRILVAAGKPGDALAVGRDVADRLAAEPDRRANLLVALARAAVTAGDVLLATEHVAAARAALEEGPDAALAARIDGVAAHVALDDGRLDEAAALAGAAVAGAAATGQPAVECEALVVLGRVASAEGPDAAVPWLQRASDVAELHGLPAWHLRARQELALVGWACGDFRPLRETRELAARYGALTTVAVMDLSLADIGLSAFDRDGCLTAALACVTASRRFGLATEPVANLWLAGAYALVGDDGAMHAAAEAALARDPADPRILADLYGRVLPTRSFVADDLGALRPQLDTMMEYVRVAPPLKSIYPGRALWAILHAIDDDDAGAAARAELAIGVRQMAIPVLTEALTMVDAIALGRRGDAEAAGALMDHSHRVLQEVPLGAGMVQANQILVAGAAIRDGWGDPIALLRESEAFFSARGYELIARRCRSMLGEAGAPVPRRGRGTSDVPEAFRALGVTAREFDVLALVARGRSTREIGEALHLSTKTVERHLSNLFDRTGVRNRAALGAMARSVIG